MHTEHLLMYICKNGKIYTFYDGYSQDFKYTDIFLDIEEILYEKLNVSKKVRVDVILDFSHFVLVKNEGYVKFNKQLYISKEYLQDIQSAFKEMKFKLLSPLEYLVQKEGRYLIITEEQSYDISSSKGKLNVEIVDFKKNEYDNSLDFEGYSVYYREVDMLKDFAKIKLGSDIYRYIPHISMGVASLLYICIFAFSYIYFDNAKLREEYIVLSQKIQEAESVEEEIPTNDVQEKRFTLSSKPFYLDIEFLIKSSEYGVSFNSISYKDKKWEVESSVETMALLNRFQKDISSNYKDFNIKEIKDSEKGISFKYQVGDKV